MKINEPIYPEPGKLYDDDQVFQCPDCQSRMLPSISGGRTFKEVNYFCENPECRSCAIFEDAYQGGKRLSTMVCIENWLADGPHHPPADPPQTAPDNRSNQWRAVRREK